MSTLLLYCGRRTFGLALFAVVVLPIAGRRRRSLPGPEKIVEWVDA
jgi:hypothetical protein